MDKVTVKVMSHSCKMADITDQEVSCKNHTAFLSLSLFLPFFFKKSFTLIDGTREKCEGVDLMGCLETWWVGVQRAFGWKLSKHKLTCFIRSTSHCHKIAKHLKK